MFQPFLVWSTLAFNGAIPQMLNRTFVQEKVAQHLDGNSDERGFLFDLYLLTRWAAQPQTLAAA